MLDTRLVIPVEVVRDKTEAEGSRDAASFPSVSLFPSYAPLTSMHDNRGVGGMVRENLEGTAKVGFLSLGGLGLMNLVGLILPSLIAHPA